MSNENYSNYSAQSVNSFKNKCALKAQAYANTQNTFYDKKNNEMLYGQSNLMKVTGVSDGTCNQINPLMLRYSGRCGAGVAGGNPCYDDNYNYIEPFESNVNCNSCNISHFIGMVFLILILVLYISIINLDNKGSNGQ